MNFFEHQDQARRRTGMLVFYFMLAVAMIVLSINLAVYLPLAANADPPITPAQWLLMPYAIWITFGTLLVIGFGTFRTILQLRDGGRSVAELVGARRIDGASDDLRERQLINVVEEMSIASGTPRPALYVMDDEPSINAFVAGYRPTEAVLVVTRGTLDTLDRDELQGVIAHEYSHVLNGDMRLNIRLMGVLAGIVMISQVGRMLMRSSGGRGKGGGQIVVIGLVLFIAGYVGLFFGALIRAAVSRQREFLADASSVQFTRNPEGILGALLRINDHAEGSLLHNARSDDISHFCFGEAVSASFSSMMATHPPLQSRIDAIDPTSRLRHELRDRMRRTRTQTGESVAAPPAATGFAASAAPIRTASAAVVESIGSVTPQHLDYARSLHSSMPGLLLAAVEEANGARNLVYALLLAGTDGAHRAAARSLMTDAGIDAVAVESLVKPVGELGARGRLPLLNLLIPSLRELPVAERSAMLRTAERLVQADRRVTVFEFALLTILKRHLVEDSAQDPPVKFYKYEALLQEIRLLLSVIARAGAGDESGVNKSFGSAMAQFSRQAQGPVELQMCSFNALDVALLRINQLAPMLKKSVIEACADCIIHDGKVLPAETELLQALSVSLDCPMPPLLGAAA